MILLKFVLIYSGNWPASSAEATCNIILWNKGRFSATGIKMKHGKNSLCNTFYTVFFKYSVWFSKEATTFLNYTKECFFLFFTVLFISQQVKHKIKFLEYTIEHNTDNFVPRVMTTCFHCTLDHHGTSTFSTTYVGTTV